MTLPHQVKRGGDPARAARRSEMAGAL